MEGNTDRDRVDLFPRIDFTITAGNTEEESLCDLNSSVGASDGTSSVRHFKEIFNGHNDSNEHGTDYQVKRTDTYLSYSTLLNDPGSDLGVTDGMDSAIIDDMSIDRSEGEKFKYLKAYTDIYNLKNKGKALSPEFDSTDLSDYDKYVKQCLLNEAIFQKVKEREKGSRVLEVVEPSDLTRKFHSENVYEVDESLGNTACYRNKGKRFLNLIFRTDRRRKLLNYDSESLGTSTNSPRYLQRRLNVRHLQMISFGGTLGVGLFLNSGKCFTIAGPFGTLLAFVVCGVIVLATVISFCEMAAFVSVIDGVSGLGSRFVNDAFGFASGWSYFLSFAIGISSEVVASVIMLSYYNNLDVFGNKAISGGFVTLFVTVIFLANVIDVRIFGEVEYISSLIKLFGLIILMVIMIIMNRGVFGSSALGFKYWNHLKSNFDENIIFGLFRPSFNLHDTGMDQPGSGIEGNGGRFLSFFIALLVAAYAYSGTEIVCIAACEAQNPRRALPSAMRRVFWRVAVFYCLSIFLVSLNIYSGDPRLLRYYLGQPGIPTEKFNSNFAINYVGGNNCAQSMPNRSGLANGAESPWIVALVSMGLCNGGAVLNGFLIFFAITCGNAQLYVSSRTVYSLALQNKAPAFLTKCNRYGTPYYSVIFAASFSLLSYTCVSEGSTVVFQNLTSIISSSGIIVWFSMCLSYIRFYYGLKKRPDIISRDDKSFPYKSFCQPYSAFIGLIGSSLTILGMGYVVFLKDEWNTMFFFSSYGALIIFAVLYFGYALIMGTNTPNLEALDFDSGRTEMDRYIWDGGKEYNNRDPKTMFYRFISWLC